MKTIEVFLENHLKHVYSVFSLNSQMWNIRCLSLSSTDEKSYKERIYGSTNPDGTLFQLYKTHNTTEDI